MAVAQASSTKAGAQHTQRGVGDSADAPLGLCVCRSRSRCRITDSSGEGFAVRLFKEGNPAGFVRAFSDAPTSMTSEFNKVSSQSSRSGALYHDTQAHAVDESPRALARVRPLPPRLKRL